MNLTRRIRTPWAALNLLAVLTVLIAACGTSPTAPPPDTAGTVAAAVAQTQAAQQTFEAAVAQTVAALAPTSAATPVPAGTDTPAPAAADTDTPLPPEASASPRPPSGTQISVWASLAQAEQAAFQAQIDRFQQDNPSVRVSLVNVPFGDMDARLATAFNAGNPPDVAVLPYNSIVSFGSQGLLNAIDRADINRFGDYLDDSKLDVMINKVVYAVPWHRQACAPHYVSLALPKGSGTHPKLGLALANYVNQPGFQTDNYHQLGWLPIRISLYDALGLHCDEVQVLRLAPADLSNAVSLVNQREKLIQDLLGGAQLNPGAATAWVDNGEMNAAAEPLKNPVTSAQVKRGFDGDGMVIGGLFVESSPYIETGNYAVTCRAEGSWASCMLSDPSGMQITVSPSQFQRMSVAVGQPFATVELGSFHQCWYFDSLKICINIGE
jgi:ABC-type glycerol-3-phosphate transport system substrate-binding protein